MSSFYDDASLVVIPSGYKTSKVYAEKPTDGSGDLAFTRTGDTATRVNSAGLIERVRTNLVLQSNTFSTTWANDDSTETSGQTGYDGTTNAWLLSKTAANGRIGQVLTVSGSATFSIYAKAGTDSWVRLASSDAGVYAYFNLGTGAVGSTGGSTTAAITSVGNGWYRCSISGNASFTFFNIWVADADNDTSGASGNILIQSAQIETGDIATDYIPTTTAAVSVGPVANVPRLDYTNSSCPRLLLEPQRTNLWTNSESFSGGSESIVTYTANSNDTLDPAGYNGADKFAVTTSGGDAHTRITRTLAVQAFSTSVYVKGAAGQKVQLFLARDGYTEIKGTSNYTLNGSWQRLTFSDTFSTTSSTVVLGIEFGFTSSDSVAGQLYYVWGAQVEAGAYATSYIPTLAASATRGADLAAKTGISSLIGQSEGVVFVDFEVTDPAAFQAINVYNNNKAGNTISTVAIQFNLTEVVASIFLGNGTFDTIGLNATGYGLNQRLKVAFRYKSGDLALYVNGVQKDTESATYTAVGTKSEVFLGDTTVYFGYKGGLKINNYMQFTSALTNAELAELTTL